MESDLSFGNLNIAIVGTDFGCVLPALLTCVVGVFIFKRLDAELPGQRVQERHWNRQRIFQKGAEITNRTKLHGESKPVMPTALLRDQCLVNVVEKEATGEVIG